MLIGTETAAIMRVAVDEGDITISGLFDQSAALIQSITLLRRLQHSYGVDGAVFHWFEAYHSGRRQSDSKATSFVNSNLLWSFSRSDP